MITLPDVARKVKHSPQHGPLETADVFKDMKTDKYLRWHLPTAREHGLEAAEALGALLNNPYFAQNGQTWASGRSIAESAGMPYRSYQRGLATLIKAGLIIDHGRALDRNLAPAPKQGFRTRRLSLNHDRLKPPRKGDTSIGHLEIPVSWVRRIGGSEAKRFVFAYLTYRSFVIKNGSEYKACDDSLQQIGTTLGIHPRTVERATLALASDRLVHATLMPKWTNTGPYLRRTYWSRLRLSDLGLAQEAPTEVSGDCWVEDSCGCSKLSTTLRDSIFQKPTPPIRNGFRKPPTHDLRKRGQSWHTDEQL